MPGNDPFAVRPPSIGWEFVPVGPSGEVVWVWFKPPALPTGLSLSIPPELFAAFAPTPRLLVSACGLPVESIAAWSPYGQPAGPVPPTAWDTPLGPPPAGVDPQLHFWVHAAANVVPLAPTVAAPMPMPQPVPAVNAIGGTPTGEMRAQFARMDADWQAAVHYERQLGALHMQLNEMMNKLGSLNRDLTPDEKRLADRQDQNAWQDARRWLRDCSAKLSQCLKSHHIGDTSEAGRRQRFEHIQDEYVSKGIPFDGIESHVRELEQHRKTLQTLQIQMSSALSRAQADGENRARRVLAQIASKRTRRGPQKR